MSLRQFYYFFLLCRPVNLAIIAITMYLMRWNVVGLFITQNLKTHPNLTMLIDHTHFFLLVLSTVLIAGAGYIINDYFDIRIDRINKPEKVIVGKYIKKRVAMLTHTVMNIVAVGIGVYLSLKYNNWLPVIFHITTTSLLWWYSVVLKRKFLIGNLVIALLSSMVPLLVGWFEIPMSFKEYSYLVDPNNIFHVFNYSMNLIVGFSAMAFLTTLVREILKDMADFKGDEAQKCTTLPIVLGLRKSKSVIVSLLTFSILCIGICQQYFYPGKLETFYTLTFIAFPLLVSLFITYSSDSRNRFLLASNFIKISMFAAILFTFIIAHA